MEKHYLSADDYLRDQWRLAELVRGGAPVAIAVHEFLKCTGWDVRHIPLKCASYTGIGQNEGKVVFTFGDEIFGLFRAGDKVLFIDDVFDTGKTAAAVMDRMHKVGADAKIACVYWKPEKNKTHIKPDYIAKDIGNDWIVFPHEIEGLSPAEVRVKDPALAAIMERFA